MSKTVKVLEILKEYQYKNTNNGIFVYIDTANGKEEVSIRSDIFHSIIADDFQRKNEGATVSLKTIKDCIFNYQGSIIKNQPKINTRLRINMEKDSSVLRIDMGDKKYHYIEITSEDWCVKSDGDKYFSRNNRQAELPLPQKGGDIELLFQYCRVPEDMQNVFIAYVVSCFIDIIHPCLVIQGVAGSSKSTLSKFLKMIIDPCVNNAPCIFPKSETELKDIYNSNYFVAYDNLQRLNYKQSDYLCSIVTGSQVLRRKLYTDSETCQYDLRQPIVLNGISGIISKEDMLDRSIIMELPPISQMERKSERKLMEDFQNDLPSILGGIMDVLSLVLATYEADSVDCPPQLIDFYEYGYYICEAVEVGRGEMFCQEYWNAIELQRNEYKENDNLIPIIDKFLDYSENEWLGTMGELCEELQDFETEWKDKGVRSVIPPTPNRLSREINAIRHSLESVGISVEYDTNSKNCRVVKIYK